MGTPAVGAAGQQQMSPQQINMMQRRQVLSQAVRMKQQIYSGTFNPANGNIVNIPVRAVGLITRFIVEATATYAELGGGTAAVTQFGAMNTLSNITFTDLQNNQRHNSFGHHFSLVSAFKEKQPYASAYTVAQGSGTFGGNWPICTATAPTTGATGSSRTVYEVPLAYSEDDLRGAIYANVVSNQMNLQLTVNTTPCPDSGDDTFAVFYGTGGTSTISSITLTVYQEYLDQLPVGQNGIVIPILDTSTVYQLLNTNFTSIAAGQDFYIQYTNFRRYMSAIGIYNSTGTVGGRVTGADINYWALKSANLTSITQCDPLEQARVARRILGTDPPAGVYYFPSRTHPIYTLTYGNMQLDLNPITASSAYLLMLWEFFGQQNTLSQAGSLPANG